MIVLILVMGAIIKRIRTKNEKRIQNLTRTGEFQQNQRHHFSRMEDQPRQSISPKMSSLKQSVKDILVLNWWTVLFVTPRLFTLTIMTVEAATEKLLTIDAAFAAIYVMSNPFVYAFTQSLLRKKLKSWFCRKRDLSPN